MVLVVDPVTVFEMRKEQNKMRDVAIFQTETQNAIREVREQLAVVARQVNALTFALEAELGLQLPEDAPLNVPPDLTEPMLPGMTITPAQPSTDPVFKQIPVDPSTGEPVVTQEVAGVFANGEPGGLFPPAAANDPEVTGAAEHPDRPDTEPVNRDETPYAGGQGAPTGDNNQGGGYLDDSVDPSLKDA